MLLPHYEKVVPSSISFSNVHIEIFEQDDHNCKARNGQNRKSFEQIDKQSHLAVLSPSVPHPLVPDPLPLELIQLDQQIVDAVGRLDLADLLEFLDQCDLGDVEHEDPDLQSVVEEVDLPGLVVPLVE
jgi:hypothetical protein